jgi:hypothetical protein
MRPNCLQSRSQPSQKSDLSVRTRFSGTIWCISRVFLGSLLLSVAILMFGCASQQYGARTFPVHFQTIPENAVLYVIPDTVWMKYKESLFANTDEANSKLAHCRCYGGEKQVEFLTYMLVLDIDGKRTYRPYTPKAPEEKITVAAEKVVP